ncbi:MAG: glycosyltransferase [Patescibacteria group bacterium]
MEKKPLSIFLVNCDWRDIFGTSPAEFRDKLERDRLGASFNIFFVFSWARTSYEKTVGNVTSLHEATRFDVFRPLLDLVTFVKVPWVVREKRLRPDLWLCYDFGFVPALWLAKTLYGGKIVMCLNNQPRIYSYTRKFGWIKSLYSRYVEYAFSPLVDRFFTINETMKEYIKKLGVPEKDISIFSMNTIDRDREFIAAVKKGTIRKKYNIPTSSKIILTVARLEAEKNYPKLLELFAGLGEGYALIALGRGSMLGQLQEQARKLGIEERVFFPGFVHREEIWNYYADADAFVLLSKAEALGVVLWEAMYTRVPVVGSDVPGILETIGKEGERGRVWRDTDGQEGFNRIISTLDDTAMLDRAYAFVQEKISNNLSINDIV